MQGRTRLRLSPLPQRGHDVLTHRNEDDVISELSDDSVECVLRSPVVAGHTSSASSHAALFDDYDAASTVVLLQRRPSQPPASPPRPSLARSHSAGRSERPRGSVSSSTASERSKRSLPSSHSINTCASSLSSSAPSSTSAPSGALFASLLMRQRCQPPRATRRLSLYPHVQPASSPHAHPPRTSDTSGAVLLCKDEQEEEEVKKEEKASTSVQQCDDTVCLVATEVMPPVLHSTFAAAGSRSASVARLSLVVTLQQQQQQREAHCTVDESVTDIKNEHEGRGDDAVCATDVLVEVSDERDAAESAKATEQRPPALHLSEEAYAALCATGVAPVQRVPPLQGTCLDTECVTEEQSEPGAHDAALCERTSGAPAALPAEVCVVDEVELCNVVPVLPRTFPLQMLAQQVVPCTVCIDGELDTSRATRWLPRLRAAQRSHLLQLLSAHRASAAEAMSVGHTLHFLTTSQEALGTCDAAGDGPQDTCDVRSSEKDEEAWSAVARTALHSAHADYLREERAALQARTAQHTARGAVHGAVVEWCSGAVGYCSDVGGLFEEQRVRAERTFYLPPTAHPALNHHHRHDGGEDRRGEGEAGDADGVVSSTPQLPPRTLRGAAQRQLARLRRFHHEQRVYMAGRAANTSNAVGTGDEADAVSPERALYAHLSLSTTVLCPFIEQLHVASSPAPETTTASREANTTNSTRTNNTMARTGMGSRRRARNTKRSRSHAAGAETVRPSATAARALLLLRPDEDTNTGSPTGGNTPAAHGVALHACFPQLAQCLQRDAWLTQQLRRATDDAAASDARRASTSVGVSWNRVLDTMSSQCVADVVLEEALLFGLAPAHAPYALRLLPPTEAFASLLHTALRTCIDAYARHVLPRSATQLAAQLPGYGDGSDGQGVVQMLPTAQAAYTEGVLHAVWQAVPRFVWTRLRQAWPQMPCTAATCEAHGEPAAEQQCLTSEEINSKPSIVCDALLHEVRHVAAQHARQALAETSDALLQHVLTALRPVLHRRTFIMYELLRILSSKSLRLAHRALVLRYRNWYYHTPSPAAVLQLLQHSALFRRSLRRAFPDHLAEQSDNDDDNSSRADTRAAATADGDEEHAGQRDERASAEGQKDRPLVHRASVTNGKLHLALDANTRPHREGKGSNTNSTRAAMPHAEAEDSNTTSRRSGSNSACNNTAGAPKAARRYVPEAALLEPYYLDRFAAYVMQAYHTTTNSSTSLSSLSSSTTAVGGNANHSVQGDAGSSAALHAAFTATSSNSSGGGGGGGGNNSSAHKDFAASASLAADTAATRSALPRRPRGRPPHKASKPDEPAQPQLSHSYDDHALRAVLRSLRVKGRTMSLEEMDAYMRSRFTNGVP